MIGIGTPNSKSKIEDRKSTRLNSSHLVISYAVFCLKKNYHSRWFLRTGGVLLGRCGSTGPAVFPVCAFFFNDTATTEIYTLSLHDALPICWCSTDAAVPPSTFSAGQRYPSNTS